ncbi:hypothetical protein ACLQ3C_16275 [Gordonia sp. DT30]|uniref:hypothetical protein n=1 Tax=unclassified Gordonia (in: high G+C Gram-positive bacteria) TaxID=2657482 RepID=UPI003CFAC374
MPIDRTVPAVVVGLIGGYGSFRVSGRRELGGAVLTAAGVYSTRQWAASRGPAVAAGLLGTYLAAFGISHPLAKKMGGWPSVVAVTAVTGAVTLAATSATPPTR